MSKSGSSIQYGRSRPDRHLDQPPAERSELVDPLEDEGAGWLRSHRRPVRRTGRRCSATRRGRTAGALPCSGSWHRPRRAGACPTSLSRARPSRSCGECYDAARAAAAGRPLLCTWLMAYTKGLHELGDGCFAYLQPDGGWGWSNAGLVVGDGQSLLVDTLFDLHLTAEMLDAMAPHTAAAPISHVVNTHANGDHCYGNQLVAGAEIIASTAAAEEMGEVPPVAARRPHGTPGRGRRAVPAVLRRRSTSTASRSPRRPARSTAGSTLDVGGRQRRADRGRARRTRKATSWSTCPTRPHGVHRRHPVHRRHADRVGRARSRTGSPRAT